MAFLRLLTLTLMFMFAATPVAFAEDTSGGAETSSEGGSGTSDETKGGGEEAEPECD